MKKKYELIDYDDNIKLYRVRALRSFAGVKEGDIGGWVAGEHNLSQDGCCWIKDNACVCENARICGNALVYENAVVCGNAIVGENALVRGKAMVYGNSRIGDALVCDNVLVYGDARIYGDSRVYGDARVCGNAQVYGDARVYGESWICGEAVVCGGSIVSEARHVLNVSGLRCNLTITPQIVVIDYTVFTHDWFRNLTLEQCQDEGWTEEEFEVYKLMLRAWEVNNRKQG